MNSAVDKRKTFQYLVNYHLLIILAQDKRNDLWRKFWSKFK